jgi:hypothetical protein
VADAGGCADHREDLLDVGCQQALAQHALADHAGRAEDHDLHRFSPSVNPRTASVTGRRRSS